MSDEITRAINWVGCSTNSPAHAEEIKAEAHDALRRLYAELAAERELRAGTLAEYDKLIDEWNAERERVQILENELDIREDEDCNEENYLQSQVDKLTAELAAEREKFDKMSAVAATERHRAAAEYERGFAEGKAFVERQVHAAIDAVLEETGNEKDM